MKNSSLYTLILASKSPRRKELIGHVGIPFQIETLDVDEISSFTEPCEVVMDIAKLKGEAVFNELRKKTDFGSTFFPLVVASDTLVALGGEIFGKPSGREEAKEMLLKLSGKTHMVYTAVYLSKMDFEVSSVVERNFYCKTEVTFADIKEDILEHYLDSGESLDKAGAYGIQASALTFITGVQGSYSNVVGFPLPEYIDNLKDFLGFKEDKSGKWRDCFVR